MGYCYYFSRLPKDMAEKFGSITTPQFRHGFVKKTQKTPPSEIEKAKKYRSEFLSRRGQEHG